jgi:hypothetical protein
MRWTPVVVALTFALESASAQVVRGVVTERVSGARVPGVVVSVGLAGDTALRHGLTNTRGEYAIILVGPGRYSLSAKRIGVERFEAPVLEIRAGETKRVDIVLARFDYKLPTVRVAANNLCIPKQNQLRTIVSLWDEVRTALIAAEVSQEQHLIQGWLTVYNRSLEPQSLRILQDQRSVSQGVYDRPMRSITGDSLVRTGFWRAQDSDTLEFHGPDANALLSDAFQSNHCFELVSGSGRNKGMHGLEFRPRRNRPTGGINGTIWIDAGTFELRFVDFRYTNLITIPRNVHLGGEVHFLRHETGAWVVRRWFIRMPQFPDVESVAVVGGRVVRTRHARVYRVIEEGGGLFAPGLVPWEKPGTIVGTVTDSTGRAPLQGTTVSLSGTPFSVEVDSSGAFRFDSIPSGAYTLIASHRTYADLGQLVDDEPLNIVAGETFRSRMKAVSTSELVSILCDGRKVEAPDATLRVTLTHSDSATAVNQLPVWLRWPDPEYKEPKNLITPGIEVPLLGEQSKTDKDGVVTFCGVPSNTRLELVMLLPADDPEVPKGAGARSSRIGQFIVRPGEVTSRTASVRPPEIE